LLPSPAPHIIVVALPLPERKLIARVRSLVERASSRKPEFLRQAGILAGIGDDCAILRVPPNYDTLVTTDFSLEGVHFRREWHPPESVGHRCLARGLSDIAAMGGEPVAIFLSLALPPKLPQAWVDGFFKGLLRLARQLRVTLAGGDTSQSHEGVLADIVVIGSVPRGESILRSGARPGDRIYVTGELGGSAATLDLFYRASRKKLNPRFFSQHFFPQPRINVARILREKRIAKSMIDISDGFSTDLRHICEESKVGAEIWRDAVPGAKIGNPARQVDSRFALHGGEDYELLFTTRRGTRVPATIENVRITEIGVILPKSRGVLLRSQDSESELMPLGWEHFRQPSPHK
jgi:thiamine-monophosphate kinase